MQVVKRSGRREDVSFDKITARSQESCKLWTPYVDYIDHIEISKKVIQGLYLMVYQRHRNLDNLAAETAATMATEHPEYAILAARIAISNLAQEYTKKSFSETMRASIWLYRSERPEISAGLDQSDKYIKIIEDNADRLDSAIIYDRDYSLWLFWIQDTWSGHTLLRMNGKVVERPQHLSYACSSWYSWRRYWFCYRRHITWCQRSGLSMLLQHYLMLQLQNHNYLLASY